MGIGAQGDPDVRMSPPLAASLRGALGPHVYYEGVRDVLMDVIATEVSPGKAADLAFPEDDAVLSGDSFEASLAQFRDAAWTWRR